MPFQEELSKMIRANEGVRTKTYKCSLGYDTVGVGFNLERKDAKGIVEAMGVDYEDLRAGKVVLTNDQVDHLLGLDLKAVIDDCKVLFKTWDKMPQTAQLVLCDMRFQLGGAGLRGFKNTIKAFEAGDWKKAAEGLRSSLAYKQTTKRWERNAKALEAL
jgi:lysozyme